MTISDTTHFGLLQGASIFTTPRQSLDYGMFIYQRFFNPNQFRKQLDIHKVLNSHHTHISSLLPATHVQNKPYFTHLYVFFLG